jgi:tetratricopeptide (TPR) repeat protein
MSGLASRPSGEETADDTALAGVIRRYEERLARDPTSLAFAPLADAYRKAGRTREAIGLCRQGLERFPHYSTGRLMLARALWAEGDGEGAQAELRALLAKSPRDSEAHRLVAEIHLRAERWEAAREHLEQAAALDPGDRESRALLDLVAAGGAAAGTSPLRHVLGDDVFATATFAAVCLEQGLADEAALIAFRQRQKNPGDARARALWDQAVRAKTQRRRGS